ncbi:MAG: hypothetical protein FWD69_10055 [Polyangiaceae bacterium]|nr:hypothetical protein [Polyangiaceae bacterium]
MRHFYGSVLFVLLTAACVKATTPEPAHVDVHVSDAGVSEKLDTGLPDVQMSPKSYVVSTLAGTGKEGDANGPGSKATFNSPYGIAIGPDGSLYVADRDNNKIRRIAVDGTVSTYAGTGDGDLTDGPCATATFSWPWGIAVDANGSVYVADYGNHAIRKITATPTCQVSTLADADSVISDATSRFNPTGLTLDASGNIYFVDRGHHKIRKVALDGRVTTIAGTGATGDIDEPTRNGPAQNATFSYPVGITADAEGTLYVVEERNGDIRKITTDGQVSNLAVSVIDDTSTHATFWDSYDITIDANGNFLVANTYNNAVCKITSAGEVTTIAGRQRAEYSDRGVVGDADGPADTATFKGPSGVTVSPRGVMYVADTRNNKIRKIEPVYR